MSGCSKYDFRFSPCDQIVEVLLLRHLLASKNLRVTNFLESFNAYFRPTLTYFLEYFRSGFLLGSRILPHGNEYNKEETIRIHLMVQNFNPEKN
jgi:hypothetical protein